MQHVTLVHILFLWSEWSVRDQAMHSRTGGTARARTKQWGLGVGVIGVGSGQGFICSTFLRQMENTASIYRRITLNMRDFESKTDSGLVRPQIGDWKYRVL